MVQDDLDLEQSELTATRQWQLQYRDVSNLPVTSNAEHELSRLINELSIICAT